MTSRPETPSNGLYGSVPEPAATHFDRGYGAAPEAQSYLNNGTPSGTTDFAGGMESHTAAAPAAAAADPYGSVIVKDHSMPLRDAQPEVALNRSASSASTAYNRDAMTPSRSGTLKKKSSISRKSSLKRSGSRKSMTAGSIKGVGFAGDAAGFDHEDYNSALFTPIPTTGSPTEILANRFQAWRTLLKSLITYFREIQTSYDHRSKALIKVSNVMQNMQTPGVFLADGGLLDANRVLSDYHRHSLVEANKSKDIEADVIQALSGLRSDLAQKIKEIKSLNGDFKNTVDKEKDSTKKAMSAYAEALHDAEHGDAKTDPFLVKLGVDRAIEKQIDEENYLHRAYLNLETSGRELESIVVGEIQKAYNAIAGILKREGDDAYNTVESLRTGPIAMPKDLEWNKFVESDPSFVNPRLPLRRVEDISYPGKHNPQAAEIRAGMLERKSKYLKSYTPGWYVLSPTHLHEFKSADKIYSQPPVMSLYLPDQKLGSMSGADSSSHKFMLKGRQSGGMHRGHAWVFRAESYDTMMAWYAAIKVLTEKTGEERNAFVRQHARSVSGSEHRPTSISSDGLEEDEADQVPYSAASSVVNQPVGETKPTRPLPGGRFPSDINVNRNRDLNSPSTESEPDHDTIAAAGALPGSGVPFPGSRSETETDPYRLEGIATTAAFAPVGAGALAAIEQERRASAGESNVPNQGSAYPTMAPQQPVQTQTFVMPVDGQAPLMQSQAQPEASPLDQPHAPHRQNTNYSEWFAPAAAGAGVGALGAAAYSHHQNQKTPISEEPESAISNPTTGAPVAIPTTTNTLAHASPTYQSSPSSTRAVYDEPVSTKPIVTGVNALPTATMGAANAGAYNSNAGTSGDATNLDGPATSSAASGEKLGGLEAEGAHGTGQLFPKVVRHDTDMSVSQLHVPGEFPHGTTPGVRGAGVMGTSTGSTAAPSQWDLVRE